MTLEQLRYVVETVKYKSFRKASEKLYISQPSLSVAIQKLEKELGHPIFARSSSGVTLTPFGLQLLPFFQEMITLYEQIPLDIYGKAGKICERISIANGRFRFFAAAVGELYAAHEKTGIQLKYHDVSAEESLAMVRDGTAHVGGYSIWSFQKQRVEAQLRRDGVEFVPLGVCAPSVSVGPKNPLWSRREDWVTLDMIREFPVIYSSAEHSNLLLKKLNLYNTGNMIICNERAGRCELNEQTTGISIGAFPVQAYARTDTYPQRRVLQLRGYDFQNAFGYIYSRSHSLSALAREFIGYLERLVPA